MDDLIDLVSLFACIGVLLSADEEENENSGSPYSFEGLNITKDVTEANYEKNIYHELRALRFKHVLSREEYKHLVAHQKKMDEINKLKKTFEECRYKTVQEAKTGLNQFENKINKFHKKGYVSNETYEKIQEELKKKYTILKEFEEKVISD